MKPISRRGCWFIAEFPYSTASHAVQREGVAIELAGLRETVVLVAVVQHAGSLVGSVQYGGSLQRAGSVKRKGPHNDLLQLEPEGQEGRDALPRVVAGGSLQLGGQAESAVAASVGLDTAIHLASADIVVRFPAVDRTEGGAEQQAQGPHTARLTVSATGISFACASST